MCIGVIFFRRLGGRDVGVGSLRGIVGIRIGERRIVVVGVRRKVKRRIVERGFFEVRGFERVI